jgi:hypothetical protein
MADEYTHLADGETIESISGHYTQEKELRLEYRGRPLLVVIGHTIIDRSCCGSGGCRYAMVIGYLVEDRAPTRGGGDGIAGAWPYAPTNNEDSARAEDSERADGVAVSLVEPVNDPGGQAAIEELVRARETVTQVVFW